MNPLKVDFLKKVQQSVEPKILPGESAIEAIRRMETEKQASMVQHPASPTPPNPSAPEVIYVNGYKLPRDFFTLAGIALLVSKDPDVQRLVEVFGFSMKDLEGKPISFGIKRSKKKKKKKKKKK